MDGKQHIQVVSFKPFKSKSILQNNINTTRICQTIFTLRAFPRQIPVAILHEKWCHQNEPLSPQFPLSQRRKRRVLFTQAQVDAFYPLYLIPGTLHRISWYPVFDICTDIGWYPRYQIPENQIPHVLSICYLIWTQLILEWWLCVKSICLCPVWNRLFSLYVGAKCWTGGVYPWSKTISTFRWSDVCHLFGPLVIWPPSVPAFK